ncbi:hypothetical protein ACQ4PT_027130 [Festuca glaucescens]
MSALGAEIRRLNAEVEEAAKKNRQLINISKACEKVLSQARVGYVAESEELEDVVDAHKEELEAASKVKADELAAAAAAHAKELEALKKAHAAELKLEQDTSRSTILALQKEKTTFEAFVREAYRQLLGSCDYVETATLKDCLQTATTRVIECAADILAALQYLSPRERIPHDSQSVFKAVSDVPVVVDWL